MKHFYLFAALFLLFSCDNSTEKHETPEATPSDTVNIEDDIKRQIVSKLNIPATENFTIRYYKEQLNPDDSIDMIITVNRLEKALNDAVEANQVEKRDELGYMGLHNYIMYFDGKTKELKSSIAIPSSPFTELAVSFENVRSETFKDILIDFRIRNSCYRNYYTIRAGIPFMTLQLNLWDGLGTQTTKAVEIEYSPGQYSLAKDINVYEAELENMTFDDRQEVYQANPRTQSYGKLLRTWFFNDQDMKYYTKK